MHVHVNSSGINQRKLVKKSVGSDVNCMIKSSLGVTRSVNLKNCQFYLFACAPLVGALHLFNR